ncbi:MAG: hypothetical protein ACKVRO_10475 [Micropepsaceae bacterium]
MNFKSIALATTALVVIAAAPAQAGQYMGKVNLGLGYASENYDTNSPPDEELEYTTLHGSASVNVPYSDRVNVQIDLFGNASMDEAYDPGPGLSGSFYGGFGAGLHLNYRDPSMGALGVFAAVARANGGGDSSSDAVVFAGGLEGEYYCNAWTLSAQVGFMDSDSSFWGLVKDAGFVRAGVAYYPSSRLKLAGNVGYLDGATSHTDNASDVREVNWAFSVEYLFGKSVPVSTYIEYKGQSLEEFDPNTYELDRHEVRAGVRFYFGGGDDLQKADREGAGMESPDLITWPRHQYP